MFRQVKELFINNSTDKILCSEEFKVTSARKLITENIIIKAVSPAGNIQFEVAGENASEEVFKENTIIFELRKPRLTGLIYPTVTIKHTKLGLFTFIFRIHTDVESILKIDTTIVDRLIN